MKKIRLLILLSTISSVLLIGGCATAPDVGERERVFSPEPSSAQSIGISEPEQLKTEEPKAERLWLEDIESEVDSDDAASSVDGVHEKLERQSDDMERLD
jgi:hypothetical protein